MAGRNRRAHFENQLLSTVTSLMTATPQWVCVPFSSRNSIRVPDSESSGWLRSPFDFQFRRLQRGFWCSCCWRVWVNSQKICQFQSKIAGIGGVRQARLHLDDSSTDELFDLTVEVL